MHTISHTQTYMYVCIYIHIYTERERGRGREVRDINVFSKNSCQIYMYDIIIHYFLILNR